jgi:hypothetical protein
MSEERVGHPPAVSSTQLKHRVEAHILVAFLAHCLSATLKHGVQAHAPGLTPRAVVEKLASIQMLDVAFPTMDGCYLTCRATQNLPMTSPYCCTNSG